MLLDSTLVPLRGIVLVVYTHLGISLDAIAALDISALFFFYPPLLIPPPPLCMCVFGVGMGQFLSPMSNLGRLCPISAIALCSYLPSYKHTHSYRE